MNIDFTCHKCEATFELDAVEVIEGNERVVCPNCETKASTEVVEDFANSLADLLSHLPPLGKKFDISFTVDSAEMPDALGTRAVDDGADEEEAY